MLHGALSLLNSVLFQSCRWLRTSFVLYVFPLYVYDQIVNVTSAAIPLDSQAKHLQVQL